MRLKIGGAGKRALSLRRLLALGVSEDMLETVSVELTNAQILALPTTPVEVVAAPGVGKVLVPIVTLFDLNATAGAYTGVDADSYLALVWGAWDVEASVYLKGTGVLDGAARKIVPCLLAALPSATFAASLIGPSGTIADLENAALMVVGSNAADFTGGNAANTLKVTVYYIELDVS